MARLPLTTETRVPTRVSLCGIYGGQSGTGTVFSEFFDFILSVSFHHGSQCSFITCGMNNRAVGGCSSET
jgi:hypothetical protein